MKNEEPIDRFTYEKKLWAQGFKHIMGLDEVGRGCLAGPVVVAGVIFPVDYKNDLLKDSKQLSEKQRDELAIQIKQDAVSWIIKEGSLKLIEQKNILWASLITMHEIAQDNKPSPDFLLIDGNRFVPSLIPHQCIIKGDDKSASIAAASILAKVYRDDLMKVLHKEYPEYNWASNVGYATKDHYNGLAEFGITKHHRLGFNLKTDKNR
ncbi:MAG: ribonuclease HII [Bacteroidetes bacterium]|nr:ribonuclease HII [Bacteroidota bacterium]NCQ10641.1 ribonuclease HII [Bacteroidota bacterium]